MTDQISTFHSTAPLYITHVNGLECLDGIVLDQTVQGFTQDDGVHTDHRHFLLDICQTETWLSDYANIFSRLTIPLRLLDDPKHKLLIGCPRFLTIPRLSVTLRE